MPIRLSPMVLLPAILVAAAAGYLVADRSRAAPTTTTSAPLPVAASSDRLPPNHPAIPGMSPHGGGDAVPTGHADEPPAIEWSAPASWQTRPNPSPMRLATYKVGDSAEMSVTRAGGGIDANIQRWAAQFDGSPKADRSDKQVHGLKVTIARISGTFLGSGMSTAAAERHDGWAMLAAIVESSGSPYFFKLVGPAAQVDQARAAFDGLVDSFAPRAAAQ